MPRSDPRTVRQQDPADFLLHQLLELGQRRARVQDVAPALLQRISSLLAILPTMPTWPTANAMVHGSHDRLRSAWDSDALRLLSRRDVEIVRTWLDTQRAKSY